MSAQPVWITPPGSLGTVPEGTFYSVPLIATEADPGDPLYFEVIAGTLPTGIECSINGILQGVPAATIEPGQEVITVGLNVTSKFAVRAYTKKTVGPVTVINRLADRTFTLTVAGQNAPQWITPPGLLGEYFDGSLLEPGYQLEYINDNTTGIPPAISLVSGQLPPGLTVSDTGLISGFIGANPAIATLAGFSRNGQGYDMYPFDFNTDSPSYNYEFALKVTDGQTSAIRTFSIFVWSTSVFNASTTEITADDTFLDASISSVEIPVLLNPQGSIGNARNDTFFAYQFIGYNISNNPMGYLGTNLPDGLTLNYESGWLYGYLPNLVLTEVVYDFTVQVYDLLTPLILSDPYAYSLTVVGPLATQVIWLTPDNLGSIFNGGTSIFYVAATTSTGATLQYELLSGSDSRLPQGLTLNSTGNIVGRVSFNTFAVDSGTTSFDTGTTTFDLTYTFTVNAFSSDGHISDSHTFSITVIHEYNTPYNNLYIKCMPPQDDRALIGSLVENVNVFPPSLLYRADDFNFGLSRSVVYYHAYGLDAISLTTYLEALQINHYWKTLQLGEIKTAQALDPVTGEIIYEVVYSEVIDNLVNNDGESVDKEVALAYPVEANTPDEVDVVYPNSLENMRTQVIDVVGQESKMLPLWMLSPQANGQVLGFTPAWVIAYTQPGGAGQIAYNIETTFGDALNLVDYKADRYELDNALTVNWDRDTQQWIPTPPESTTFDITYHYQTTIQNYVAGGVGYAVGDIIKILGTQLGGISPLNDCIFTVDTVSGSGSIIDAFCSGTASINGYGEDYNNIIGITVTGIGANALWDITVVPGVVTVFDGGSLEFTSPADENTNTDAYDKYLMFPRYTILDFIPTINSVLWVNNYDEFVEWLNDLDQVVVWRNEYA